MPPPPPPPPSVAGLSNVPPMPQATSNEVPENRTTDADKSERKRLRKSRWE
jgi:hypothetical protein